MTASLAALDPALVAALALDEPPRAPGVTLTREDTGATAWVSRAEMRWLLWRVLGGENGFESELSKRARAILRDLGLDAPS